MTKKVFEPSVSITITGSVEAENSIQSLGRMMEAIAKCIGVLKESGVVSPVVSVNSANVIQMEVDYHGN